MITSVQVNLSGTEEGAIGKDETNRHTWLWITWATAPDLQHITLTCLLVLFAQQTPNKSWNPVEMLKLNPHHYQPKVPWQPMTYRHCWCPRSLLMCIFFACPYISDQNCSLIAHLTSHLLKCCRNKQWQLMPWFLITTPSSNNITLGQRLCNLTVKTLDDLQTGLGMLSHQTLLPTTVIWPAMHIVSLDLHPFFIVYNDSGLVFFLENLQNLHNYNHWSGNHMRHIAGWALCSR